jgi:two-component system, chemotaxis family, response regulator Rcp1
MKRSMLAKAYDILLVEDNPGDIRLAQEALKESPVQHRLSVVTDGEQAKSYLLKQGVYESTRNPDLILLDLNLPRLDGRALLKMIKSEQGLKRIPVIILTTSIAHEDVENTYDSHANCYITKPVDLEKFLKVIQSIEHFWLQIVRLPGETHS